MERTIVIGDIHGCYHTLSDLLKECEATKKDRYIFIGDYIDRGPFSMHVVERLLIAQQELGDKQVVLLRGNHEQFAIDTNGRLDFCGKQMAVWKLCVVIMTAIRYLQIILRRSRECPYTLMMENIFLYTRA